MLSKNKLKLIRSLSLKKHREETGLFLAEGPKLVADLLPHFDCVLLAGTTDYLSRNAEMLSHHKIREFAEISQQELKQASLLQSPRDVLALFTLPSPSDTDSLALIPQQQLCLALDGVQDPGNVGTILRIADWFGIEHIFASADTADIFAPKTLQATMGAVARVQLHRVDLPQWIASLPATTPIYGTFLDGESCYSQSLSPEGVIVMGNEGQGISQAVARHINRRLLIPNFPPQRPTSESLNVAIATAIVCAEFRRRALSE